MEKITIIYPKNSEMEALAGTLGRKMKHYSISRSISARTGIRSLKELPEPWLIVLCTPDTPGDPAIRQTIDEFIAKGLFRHILTILVDGTPETSFPDALLHEQLADGTIIDHEPLAANISGLSRAGRVRKLKTEKLRLLAPILGVSFDELLNRRARRQKRIITAIGAAVLVLGIVFLLMILQRARTFQEQSARLDAQYQRAESALQDAEQAADDTSRAVAETLSVVAGDTLQSGDTELAMLQCLSLLPERADIPELTGTLAQALKIRGQAGYIPLTAVDNRPEEQAGTAPGEQALISGALLHVLPFEYGTDWLAAMSSEGYLLCVYGESEVRLYDPETKQVIRSFQALTYPLYSGDIAFAGEVDEESGLPGADRIRVGDLIYLYRDQETSVPEDLESQIVLAQQYLGDRTLTEAEQNYFELN